MSAADSKTDPSEQVVIPSIGWFSFWAPIDPPI